MGWQRYWDIIVYRTYAELKAEAQLSYMGYVWWVLEPLLNTVLFYVLMVLILENGTVVTIGFTVVGAVMWQWFSASMMGAANSLIDAGGMLKHIYLPKYVLPVISIFSSSWKFLFLFLLLLFFLCCSGHFPNPAYVALPLVLLLEFMAIIAFTLPLALIMPYFPDARITVEAFLRCGMLISGMFFSVSQVPEQYRFYFHLNPLADLIEAYRAILIDGQWPRWDLMAYVAGLCVAGIVLSFWLHHLVDRSMVKAIHR
jgi:lipopolysaccharide transport system permease protein